MQEKRKGKILLKVKKSKNKNIFKNNTKSKKKSKINL